MDNSRPGQTWLWIVVMVLVVLGVAFLLIRNASPSLTANITSNSTPTASAQPTFSLTPNPDLSLTTTPFMVSTSPNLTPNLSPNPSGVSSTTRIFLLSEQSDSGQNGTATLTEVNGKTEVALSLTPPSSATPQPAHIHTGACPTPGAIKYNLNSVVNGKSTTTINARLSDLATQLPLAINVHLSAAQSNVYVACGDLMF